MFDTIDFSKGGMSELKVNVGVVYSKIYVPDTQMNANFPRDHAL